MGLPTLWIRPARLVAIAVLAFPVVLLATASSSHAAQTPTARTATRAWAAAHQHRKHVGGARQRSRRAGKGNGQGASSGLGQLTGMLARDHLTEESAINVNLDTETVRLPLYPGIAKDANGQRSRSGTRCWTPPTAGSRMTWASTTRPSSPTSPTAAPIVCRP